MARVIDIQALRALAAGPYLAAECACLRHDLKGWSSWPVGYYEDEFVLVGTLAKYPQEETIISEYHPSKTHYWSVDAPIAPLFYPYNQSTVWQCRHCQRVYLRHNDDGAYHVERRIRLVHPALIVDAAHAHDGRESGYQDMPDTALRRDAT